jgi:polyphosphate kinase
MEAVTAPQQTPSLDSPELFTNRELSWLQFNERVLELTEDESTPLLERVKFLAIYANNLDEFFMVRVAGLYDQVDAGIDARGPDGLAPGETIERILERTRELGHRQSLQWEAHVRPALAERGIRVIDCADCGHDELEAIDRQFSEQIFPVLTPLAVGPGRPFPYISNLSLSLAVWLRDPVSGEETFARVKVPKEVLPRFVPLGRDVFVPLETVIARHLDQLFPGMEILSHDFFRVTRDADFTVSDEADDLLRAVEDELRRRRFGEVVRLEISSSMDPDMRDYLIQQLAIDESQVIDIEGLLDLNDLWSLYDVDGHRDLRDPPWTPVTQPAFAEKDEGKADVLAAMRTGDLLVHHPYDSFASSVERLVQQAVGDPDVLAIKMTVYRTSDDSELVPSLIEAAERGKQAVCLVELKARFDERRNIGWARALEEAGAHVVHGLPGLKTHAKALLIVRREGSGARHYVHVGTGNYHAKTARLYEDFGLFTTDRDLAADVAELFNSLTGAARSPEYRKAIVAPDHMRSWFLNEVKRTIEAHQQGHGARIVLKLNSLVDARCIRALYEASQAGVPVDINVRGICCLRPGVPGVSDNIRAVSVVGRFLEHSRIYGFHRGDERLYWMGSGDLMPRNLDTRVELLVPIEDVKGRREIEETIELCLADDTFELMMRASERASTE